VIAVFTLKTGNLMFVEFDSQATGYFSFKIRNWGGAVANYRKKFRQFLIRFGGCKRGFWLIEKRLEN
jgi:hypothetical protein